MAEPICAEQGKVADLDVAGIVDAGGSGGSFGLAHDVHSLFGVGALAESATLPRPKVDIVADFGKGHIGSEAGGGAMRPAGSVLLLELGPKQAGTLVLARLMQTSL